MSKKFYTFPLHQLELYLLPTKISKHRAPLIDLLLKENRVELDLGA